MPVIKPFRGLRYADTRPASMAAVLAPPFDMIGGDQQRALLAASEHNVAWLTVAEDGPGYPGAAARFRWWLSRGILRRDADPAFYVYEQSAGETTLRGFLAAVRLGPSGESGVYPHENTFAEPIVDRLALLKATRCGLEPVFGIHTETGGCAAAVLRDALASEPLWRAQISDGATHSLRALTDPDRQCTLTEALADARVVIADGHHRWAAANALRDELRASGHTDPDAPHEFALMLLVEETGAGVQCGAFHRVIYRLPEGINAARLDEHLGSGFEVQAFPTEGRSDEDAARRLLERLANDSAPHVFGCCWATGAALVRIRDLDALLPTASRPIEPIIREFDVALLHRLILRPRLGCHGDFGPQACAVVFEKDPVAAWRKVTSGNAVMAWFVRPAPISAVLRAAFAGLKVPQKATHFHPKPPSGMVMYDLGAP